MANVAQKAKLPYGTGRKPTLSGASAHKGAKVSVTVRSASDANRSTVRVRTGKGR